VIFKVKRKAGFFVLITVLLAGIIGAIPAQAGAEQLTALSQPGAPAEGQDCTPNGAWMWTNGPFEPEVAARVQQDVRTLDGLVVNALIDAGLAAVAVPPSSILSLDDGRVASIDLTSFLGFSSGGFTPVTFGDVVRDAKRGVSICSGDLLMLELARAFRPERAIFVADVDGLFTADPKRDRDARLLDEVGPQDLSRVRFSSAARTDVTGSIEGKVRRMFDVASHAGECWIVNGNVKNRVRDALRGRRVVGTRVTRGP